MGHIFILAYARYGVPPGGRNASSAQFHPVRLDQPTWREEQRLAVNRWIGTGGPASIGSVEDIHNLESLLALKQDALQMMREMRVWGLGRKFCKVLDSFET
jgi:hypothetical protein